MDKSIILYRLSSYRRSRATIDTQFEMGFLRFGCSVRSIQPQVKDSQYLQKYKINTSHIRVLFLTFIWKFCPELIEKGYIYTAVPPLYKATIGNKFEYILDDDALEEFKSRTKRSFELGRFKGLGEMSAEEISETVMNAETRTLKRITMEDATQVAMTFLKEILKK